MSENTLDFKNMNVSDLKKEILSTEEEAIALYEKAVAPKEGIKDYFQLMIIELKILAKSEEHPIDKIAIIATYRAQALESNGNMVLRNALLDTLDQLEMAERISQKIKKLEGDTYQGKKTFKAEDKTSAKKDKASAKRENLDKVKGKLEEGIKSLNFGKPSKPKRRHREKMDRNQKQASLQADLVRLTKYIAHLENKVAKVQGGKELIDKKILVKMNTEIRDFSPGVTKKQGAWYQSKQSQLMSEYARVTNYIQKLEAKLEANGVDIFERDKLDSETYSGYANHIKYATPILIQSNFIDRRALVTKSKEYYEMFYNRMVERETNIRSAWGAAADQISRNRIEALNEKHKALNKINDDIKPFKTYITEKENVFADLLLRIKNAAESQHKMNEKLVLVNQHMMNANDVSSTVSAYKKELLALQSEVTTFNNQLTADIEKYSKFYNSSQEQITVIQAEINKLRQVELGQIMERLDPDSKRRIDKLDKEIEDSVDATRNSFIKIMSAEVETEEALKEKLRDAKIADAHIVDEKLSKTINANERKPSRMRATLQSIKNILPVNQKISDWRSSSQVIKDHLSNLESGLKEVWGSTIEATIGNEMKNLVNESGELVDYTHEVNDHYHRQEQEIEEIKSEILKSTNEKIVQYNNQHLPILDEKNHLANVESMHASTQTLHIEIEMMLTALDSLEAHLNARLAEQSIKTSETGTTSIGLAKKETIVSKKDPPAANETVSVKTANQSNNLSNEDAKKSNVKQQSQSTSAIFKSFDKAAANNQAQNAKHSSPVSRAAKAAEDKAKSAFDNIQKATNRLLAYLREIYQRYQGDSKPKPKPNVAPETPHKVEDQAKDEPIRPKLRR